MSQYPFMTLDTPHQTESTNEGTDGARGRLVKRLIRAQKISSFFAVHIRSAYFFLNRMSNKKDAILCQVKRSTNKHNKILSMLHFNIKRLEMLHSTKLVFFSKNMRFHKNPSLWNACKRTLGKTGLFFHENKIQDFALSQFHTRQAYHNWLWASLCKWLPLHS